ncbi:MAG: flippase-like domain-containing protein [Candidatus Diapherotrites archaeon]|nr:flippase-like domain-containing protein [Candidatus Diapherotrites archaeon]MBT4596643.1 flippase-like domain-containing protein [Candidatus Diapherotrites archaeon]
MKKLILSVIGIIIFVYFFLLLKFDVNLLFTSKSPELIVLALAIFLLSICIIGIRMRFFLKALGEKHNYFSELLKIEFINKFVYYVFPTRLNVPVKALILNKKLGVKKSTTLSITTFEYALDTGFMFVLGLVALSFVFQNMFDAVTLNNLFLTVGLLFVLIILFFLVPLKIFNKTLSFFSKIKNNFLKKVLVFAAKIFVSIREIWPKLLFNKQTIPAIIILAINWILISLTTELLFISYYTYVPFLWVLTISVVAVLIGGISQIPGGIGLKEVTLVGLFVFLGVPADVSLVVALLLRLFTLVPIAIGYIFVAKLGADISLKDLVK